MKNIRQKTEREKEIESKPICLFDPLKEAWCNHYDFPPLTKHCESCLIRNIVDALEDRVGSETMRWFIAFKCLKEELAKK